MGNDEYLVGGKAREIVDALVPADQQAFGLDAIDGAADTVDAATTAIALCLEALQTVGFMSSEKVVWFRDVSFLVDNVVGRSERVKERLAELSVLIKAGLPEGVKLVISTPKADKRYGFYKACKATGEIHEFNVPERARQAEKHALTFVKQQLESEGLTMSNNSMRAFVERVGSNTRQLVMEIEKLLLYLGDRKHITGDDIRHVCSASHDALLWDLTDAFGERDLPKALQVARDLAFQKQNVMGMIITLEGRIRDLMLYREALNRRWLVPSGGGVSWVDLSPEEDALVAAVAKRHPRSTHPFRAGLLAKQAKKYSMRELGSCLSAAVRAHEQLVSSRMPPNLVLEVLLVSMLGSGRKAAV